MPSGAKQLALAEVFAEDSERESTFYGFSDNETDGHHQVRHVVCKCTESEQVSFFGVSPCDVWVCFELVVSDTIVNLYFVVNNKQLFCEK